MISSFPQAASHHQHPLAIRMSIGQQSSMSRGSGQASDMFGDGPQRSHHRHTSFDHIGSSPYPFTTLRPASINTASRRGSMTVQDMLNPSDEEPRGSSRSRCTPSSSDNEGFDRPVPRSHPISQSPTATPPGHTPRAVRRRGIRATNRRRRRSSPFSTSSEASDRAVHGQRMAYTLEQQHFIWYLRIDRGFLWPEIQQAFNDRFSDHRGIGGLQCRYYRLVERNNMPQVRNMTRTADNVQRYGMATTLARNNTNVDYSWLDGEYAASAYGQVLEEKDKSATKSSSQ